MAENWDLSAVVNSSFTPANNFGNANFSENANSENPLEFLNHLTFGDDDDLYSFSELEPPKTTGFPELQDSSCEPFLVPTRIDNDALQGGGNILIPNPTASVPDFQVLAPQNHSPFLLQHYQLQNHHMIPANFPAINSPRRFIGGVRQQFRHIQQRPFLQPCQIQRPLLQRQAAPPIPIPRLSSLPAAGTRSRKKKCNQKRRVEQVPADKINSDVWSWRKYGQKPIKGSPYPRNYYRCSSSKGCTARKQVEESNTDPDMFIVCFTGEHNHPRPTINRNSVAGSRYKFFGRTNILPLNKEYEIPPPAPSTSEKGSSCLSPVVLSATSLSPTTPLSASMDHADVGADTESHVGANTETGGVDTESHIATDSDGGGGGSA